MAELSPEEQQFLDFENIEFDFETAYVQPVTKQLFQQFLREILASEQISFVEQIDSLKNHSGSNKELIELSEKIVSQFLELEARYSINLPFESVKKVKEQLSLLKAKQEEEIQKHEFENLFRPAYTQVKLTWKEDVFPRFVRSKTFRSWFNTFVKQKNKTEASVLLRQIATLKHVIDAKRDVFFAEEEFTGKPSPVTQKEVDFAVFLKDDASHWRLLEARNDGASVYFSKKPYLTTIKDRKNHKYTLSKYISYVPFNVETVVTSVLGDIKNGDPNVYNHKRLAYYHKNQQYTSFACTVGVKLGKLASKRCLQDTVTVYYDPATKTYGYIWKSFYDDGLQRIKNTIPFLGVGGYFFQEISPNVTKYTSVLYISLGSMLQKLSTTPFTLGLYRQRRREITQTMIKACEKAIAKGYGKENGTFYHEDHMGLINTLEDYCKKHLAEKDWPQFINRPDGPQYYPNRRDDVPHF